MTHYLEYEDDKSSKFWMVQQDGASHTVTYGKIGSDGRATTKEFDSAAEAQKSAEKLLKSKKKKGYKESAKLEGPERRVLDFAEAKESFDLDNYDPTGMIGYATVIVYDGDVTIWGDVNHDTVASLFFQGEREPTDELIIVDGNLTIHGCLDPTEYYPCFLVLGDFYCEILTSTDSYKHITGDAYITRAFFGNYNHGGCFIEGTTHVPLLFNSDHGCDMTVNPKTVCINYYGSDDDFFEYDYYSSDLKELFPDDLFEWHSEWDFDFDWWSIKETLKAGGSPFIEGKEPDSMDAAEIRKRAGAS